MNLKYILKKIHAGGICDVLFGFQSSALIVIGLCSALFGV
jgi:hypothetical protein